MGNRIFGTLTAAMTALAAYQLYAIIAPRPAAGHLDYIKLKQGVTVESNVKSAAGIRPLSQVVQGACAYVVIFSPSCGASVAAAKDWQRDALAGSAELSPRWHVYWVDLAHDSVGNGGLPADFRWQVLAATDSTAFQREASITALPVHILMDGTGRVVSSSVGAPSPAEMTFHDDCSVTPKYPRSQAR